MRPASNVCLYCSLQVSQYRSNLNTIPASYSYQTPTLLEIHIKGSKTKSRKEKKRKEKTREKKTKKTESCSSCILTHIPHIPHIHTLTHTAIISFTHSQLPVPTTSPRVYHTRQQISTPPRPLLVVVTCFSPLSESQVRLFLQFFSCHQRNLFTHLESRHNYTLPYPPFACP
ncbi:hypothetical protein B9Z19DRAFT_1087143 [Tuber borchii]|uniref:Uncharacterized protein n=1 Tax=Tuber borchii TaxID=42251 RepID=A0A2T6ZNH6_TUBBO|nr:hypothetical protein B9Z19DRAFT_1087143 [Tuber borchii]